MFLGQFTDLVRAEAAPRGAIRRDDHGSLEVAEIFSKLHCCCVLRHISNLVLDTLTVKRPVGSVALNTRRFCKDSYQFVSLDEKIPWQAPKWHSQGIDPRYLATPFQWEGTSSIADIRGIGLLGPAR